MNYINEIWKDIQGLEGLYQASSYGRIRSLDRIYLGKNPSRMNGRVIRPRKGVYLNINISINGIIFKEHQVHRLVAKTFIENPENKPYVNHKNGIKYDNRVENLEWCTPKENDIHASLNGLKASGERVGTSKLNWETVNEIRGKYVRGKYTNRMLAIEYNMSYHEVQLINQGKRWKIKQIQEL